MFKSTWYVFGIGWLFIGTETFVTVPVGKAFQVYNTKKLQLVMVSPQLSEEITYAYSSIDQLVLSKLNVK